MDIKYSEVFTSFQGEAGFAGMPTIWVRFFGCNLECNGFGQKDPTDPSTYVLPYKTIDISKYKTLEELPVFEYGCDSSYSWSKQYDSLVHKESVELLVDRLIGLGVANLGLCDNESFWFHPVTLRPVQLCFTGGEPMLWQKQMLAIFKEFEKRGMAPPQITVETNGTKKIKEFSSGTIELGVDLYFSISPKLFSVSGEKNAVKVDIIKSYMKDSPGWLKFVVNGTKECWDELDTYMEPLLEYFPSDWSIWVMPVGATKEQQQGETIASIAVEAMRRGYSVATRNHTYVFGNVIGS